MNSKRLSKESAKATKDSQAYMKKAKESLKKNKEDGQRRDNFNNLNMKIGKEHSRISLFAKTF